MQIGRAKLDHSFHVVMTADPDGGIVVEVPGLPGCVTHGDTQEEAVDSIIDAIGGYIAVLVDSGREIPAQHPDRLCVDATEIEHATLCRVSVPGDVHESPTPDDEPVLA
jgi:antitoxin HicB